MILLLAASIAFAGDLDGMFALDGLTTSSKAALPLGPTERLTHYDLGIRARVAFRELDDDLRFDLDYRGRENLGGTFPTTPHRLLWRAEASYRMLDDKLTIGVGRFSAPIATFAIMDGAHATLQLNAVQLEVFGGRRAITAARKNTGGLLPVVGLRAGWNSKTVGLDGVFAYTEDRIDIGGARITDDVGGISAEGRLWARTEKVRVGTTAAMIQGATYQIGPTWAEGAAEATALGLFRTTSFATFRPHTLAAVDLLVHHQRIQSWSGDLAGDGSVSVQPQFTTARSAPVRTATARLAGSPPPSTTPRRAS